MKQKEKYITRKRITNNYDKVMTTLRSHYISAKQHSSRKGHFIPINARSTNEEDLQTSINLLDYKLQ